MTQSARRPQAALDERVAILEQLARRGDLTTTERLSYVLLVAWSEGETLPALVIASSEAIAAAIGVTDRTGRRVLEGLQEAGLLRHREGSVYEILIPDPTPGPAVDQLRAVGGDPQQRLPFGPDNDRPEALTLHSPDTSAGTDVRADIDAGTDVRAPVATQGEPGGETPHAVLGSCIKGSWLTVNVEVEAIDWEMARQRANRIVRQLWPDRDFKTLPLSKTDRTRLMRLSALAQFLGSEWLNTGVQLTVDAHESGRIRISMLGWLQGTLANRARQATGYVIDEATLQGIPVPPHFLQEGGDSG